MDTIFVDDFAVDEKGEREGEDSASLIIKLQ
jgi:hypothetical protein